MKPPEITICQYVEPYEETESTLRALARYAGKTGEVELQFRVAMYPRTSGSYYDPPDGGPEIWGVSVLVPGTTRVETIEGDAADWLIEHFREQVEIEADEQAQAMGPDEDYEHDMFRDG